MSTVNETILVNALTDEISRLRLAIGYERDEAFRLIWDGLDLDKEAYDLETQRIQYGGVV